MKFDQNIITGKVCPYCGKPSEYVDSREIYGKSYGMIYLCRPCNAYVGVHHGTSKTALGRLANKELRFHKRRAHLYFDNIWGKAIKKGMERRAAREKSYKWLSESLGLPPEHTHIGMFDIEMCLNVVQVCKPYCKKISRKEELDEEQKQKK